MDKDKNEIHHFQLLFEICKDDLDKTYVCWMII